MLGERRIYMDKIRDSKDVQPLDASKLYLSVGKHFDQQPASVQRVLQEIAKGELKEDAFSEALMVGEKRFLFAKKSPDCYIYFLAQDKDMPNKWKSRGFFFSNSDHQFKCAAGTRRDGSDMKGEEDNPLHHYVQSGKIAKQLYKYFNAISDTDGPGRGTGLTNNLPNFETGEYTDEFELKEDYLELRNPEWRSFQKKCQDFFNGEYEYLVQKSCGMRKGMNECFFEEYFNEHPPKDPILADLLHEWNCLREIYENVDTESEIANAKFLKKQWMLKYPERVGEYMRKRFAEPMPETLLPDFSKTNIVDSYEKGESSENPKDHICIEEYEVKSPEGDHLVFAMARNDAGQVYIDNIYDPRVGITDYGTYEKIVNMGHLVYKPNDYLEQAFGISEQDKERVGRNYVDITRLWERIPVIGQYKEELKRRGVMT